MNTEIKTLWLEALRSGKYIQGDGALRDQNNKYCCLGVLCDLATKNPNTDIDFEWQWDSKHDEYGIGDVNDYLPTVVADWAEIPIELRTNDNHVPTDSGFSVISTDIKIKSTDFSTLACMNDNGASFKAIAKIIEEQL